MQSLALAVFVVVKSARVALSWLNLRHLQREGHVVPAVLAGQVDAARLARMSAYTAARARFGLVQSLLSTLIMGGFLFAGGLAWYDAQVTRIWPSFVLNGVLFSAGLLLANGLLSIPFQLYSDFRLETAYGFNRQTPGLWWSDWLKSTLLSLLLMLALSAGALLLVRVAPHSWWFWVSALVSAVTVLLMFVSPYLIEPLFYRMEPLDVAELQAGIRSLTERAGVHVGRVLKVDASRRSSHSNAYFTGLGREKRVVLFDTLLAQMSEPQILAVLAHELGHWKKHHVLVRMAVMQVLLLLGAYLLFRFIPSSAVPELVGATQASFPARLVILAVAASQLSFPSRRFFRLGRAGTSARRTASPSIFTARRSTWPQPWPSSVARTCLTCTPTPCTPPFTIRTPHWSNASAPSEAWPKRSGRNEKTAPSGKAAEPPNTRQWRARAAKNRPHWRPAFPFRVERSKA